MQLHAGLEQAAVGRLSSARRPSSLTARDAYHPGLSRQLIAVEQLALPARVPRHGQARPEPPALIRQPSTPYWTPRIPGSWGQEPSRWPGGARTAKLTAGEEGASWRRVGRGGIRFLAWSSFRCFSSCVEGLPPTQPSQGPAQRPSRPSPLLAPCRRRRRPASLPPHRRLSPWG